jgi:hypothetical protein
LSEVTASQYRGKRTTTAQATSSAYETIVIAGEGLLIV